MRVRWSIEYEWNSANLETCAQNQKSKSTTIIEPDNKSLFFFKMHNLTIMYWLKNLEYLTKKKEQIFLTQRY